MSRIGTSLRILLIFWHVMLISGVARAEDPAAAEALFQEGRRFLADGQISLACEKFKESYTLDPMSGTLLNLAACYEKAGRFATAWARFRNAASLAKNQGKTDQFSEANRRAKALESELSYIKIVVRDPEPGLEVRRNDVEVVEAAFGVDVPIDPGRTEVVASAPGYKTFRTTVEIGARRDKQVVTVPKLSPIEEKETETLTTPLPAPSREDKIEKTALPPTTAPKTDGQKTEPSAAVPLKAESTKLDASGVGMGPWILGGIGLAVATTGGVFGVLAIRSDMKAYDLCPKRKHCSQAALDMADRRDQEALISTVGVGVGLAAVASAAVWYLVARPSSSASQSASISLHPAVTKESAALWFVGQF